MSDVREHIRRGRPKALVAVIAVIALSAIGFGLGFGLTGGGSSSSSVTTTTNSNSADVSPNQKFLGFVSYDADSNVAPGLASAVQNDPSAVVEAGEKFCSDMDNGSSVQAEVDAGAVTFMKTDPGIRASDADTDVGIIIGAATQIYCPQWVSEANSWLQANGE